MTGGRPALMGIQEIQRRLGRSRQRVQQLTTKADFPEPYQTLAMGRVWLADDVEAWIRKHRPNRARK
ncbi:helix-turn-helix transcriptional regulator [Actinoplanes sp. NPDC020271]|uniref:helix-turn-helix transcriptional regulator n=1 Tax=Actinoplanes sp. NPDC020271 TaxID=3363896 RepID=UPI0037AFE60C